MQGILFLVLLVGVMYFVTIRPQQKRVREQRDLVGSLGVGDEVVTAGGIIGTIKSMGDTELLLDAGPGTEIRVARVAITQRLTPLSDAED